MISTFWFSKKELSGTDNTFSFELVLMTGNGEQELSILSKAVPPNTPAQPRQVDFMKSRRSMLKTVAYSKVHKTVSGIKRNIARIGIGHI